jgi:hypothetical protein
MIGLLILGILLWVVGGILDRAERDARDRELPPWARRKR